MTDENKNNSINGHYKHEKKRRTGGEFQVNSASYAWWDNNDSIIQSSLRNIYEAGETAVRARNAIFLFK